jgi:hypothetical protein
MRERKITVKKFFENGDSVFDDFSPVSVLLAIISQTKIIQKPVKRICVKSKSLLQMLL